MEREMKVYGGRLMHNGKLSRAVVAARTKKKAREVIGCSVGEFNNYWSITHNEEEVSNGLFFPEALIVED